ncbi:MAG: hypothetical protein E7671_00335 [Ruminococcaceae bacterium]|nr:hypothetical protein [Oscillospiraceae bacterium]
MTRIRKPLLAVLLIMFFACLCLTAHASDASTANANIYETKEYNELSKLDMSILKSTSVFNWKTGEGLSPTKSSMNALPSYLLSFSSDTNAASLISSPTERINAYDYRQLSFAVKALCGEDPALRQNCSFILTLSSYNHSLICKGSITSGVWNVISFDVGAWKARHDITGIKIEIVGENEDIPLSEIDFSGPYVPRYEKPTMPKFMSYGLYASGSELEILSKGTASEALRIYLGSQRVSISGRAAVPFSGELSNAVKIVLSNNSSLRNMQFVYTHLDVESGKYVTAQENVPLEVGANRFSYLIKTDDVSLISSFSLVLDSATGGSVTIHSIEPISVYDGFSDEPKGEISSCKVDTTGKTLTIKGSILHNYLISHSDYSLACYKLRTGETLDAAIKRGDKPVDTAKMSSRFSFEVKVAQLGELALVSKYAVVALSQSGEYTLIAPPASIEAKFGTAETASGRTNIKGLQYENISSAIDCGAGSAIIDVYLDRLTSSTHAGHLHTVENTFIYFDADYVRTLDNKIKNLYASGCKVYLRLLISADADTSLIPYATSFGKNEKTEFLAVNIANKKAEEHFFATVDFISGRYSTQKNGRISGLILGKTVDIMETRNYSRDVSISDYAHTVSMSLDLMARTAATSIPGIEIILPVSDKKEATDSFDTEQLLSSICLYFDETGGLDYSLMLESTHAPYSENGKKQSASEDSDYYCTDNIYTFERVLDYLSRTFENAPKSYIYCYSPTSLDAESLNVAYIYNYYSIMFSEMASAFVLSLPDGEEGKNAANSLSYLMKYIDTEKNINGELSLSALEFLGATSFEELIDGYDSELIKYRVFSETDPLDTLPETVKGSYPLWDFSDAFGTLGWFEGNNCRSLSLDATAKDGKALCAEISGNDNVNAYSDIVYKYEYTEDISSIPYIVFDLELKDGNDDSLYEIVIIMGGENHRLEAKKVVRGGGDIKMIIDVGVVSDMKKIDYIRICVRKNLSQDDLIDGRDFKLYLKKVTAHSDRYGDDALERAVLNARAKARNTTLMSDGDILSSTKYELIASVLVIIIIGVLMVAFYEKRQK